MNIAEIEIQLNELVEQPFDSSEFALRLLEIYNAPKATLTKLRKGTQNKGEQPGDLLWARKLYFRPAAKAQVATYTLYNIDRVKLEHLLHTFFAEVRLNLEITDRFGKKIKPREWFLVPPGAIAEAVSRLKDGSIVNVRYDAGRAAIVPLDSR